MDRRIARSIYDGESRRGSVLVIDVTAQIHTALERPGTPDAGERPETGVLATVSDEVRRLTERLSALTTHIRFLTCTGELPSETNHSLVTTRPGVYYAPSPVGEGAL